MKIFVFFLSVLFSLFPIVVFSGTLYGLNDRLQEFQIDPLTARATPIGSNMTDRGSSQVRDHPDLDKQRGIYYFADRNFGSDLHALYGKDIKTGKIIYTLDITPHFLSSYFGSPCISVIPETGEVILFGTHSMFPNTSELGIFSPSINTYRTISKLDRINHPSQCFYDPVNQVFGYSIYFGIQLVDIHTGNFVKQIPLPEDFYLVLAYDSKSGLLYFVVSVDNVKENFVMMYTINIKQGTTTFVAEFDDYTASNFVTIDPENRISYMWLKKPSPNDDCYLVTFDLSRKVITNSTFSGPWRNMYNSGTFLSIIYDEFDEY